MYRFLLFLSLFIFYTVDLQAQLAKSENLIEGQVRRRLGELGAGKNGTQVDSIRWEAEQLAVSEKESYMLYAQYIYRYLGDKIAEKEISDRIVTLFPKGMYVAQNQLDVLLDTYKNRETAEEAIKKWALEFKEVLDQQKFSDDCYSKIAQRFLIHGELLASNAYILEVKDSTKLAYYQYALASTHMNLANYELAESLLLDLQHNYQYLLDKDRNLRVRTDELLVKLFVSQKKWKQSLDLIRERKLELYDEEYKTLVGLGKYADAFIALDRRFRQKKLNADEEKEGQFLFERMGKGEAGWKAYKAEIENQKLEQKQQKWGSTLIDIDPIDFELTDRNGKAVKIADFKGKIVVLDFWATWCGNCINAFPGMQEVVSKYKQDKDVVFLFIDTWEKTANYKEKALALIDQKGYDFDVFFDQVGREGSLANKLGAKGIPFQAFIDRQNRIRFLKTGGTAVIKEIADEVSYKIDYLKRLNRN